MPKPLTPAKQRAAEARAQAEAVRAAQLQQGTDALRELSAMLTEAGFLPHDPAETGIQVPYSVLVSLVTHITDVQASLRNAMEA